MDLINIFLTIIILSNLLLVVVASVGYKRNDEKGLVYKAYLVNNATIIWWLGSTIFFRISDTDSISFYTKNMYVSATLIASSFYYFSHIFPDYKRIQLKRIWLALLANIVVVFVITFSDHFIRGGVVNNGLENEVVFGSYFWIYALYILYFFCTSFGRLFVKYKKEADNIRKSQLQYIFWGYSISGGVAFIVDLALPIMGNFNFLWLGPAATICVVTLVTFAIRRHRLFSMKILAIELFVFALWIVVIVRISAFVETPEPLVDVLYLVVIIFLGTLFIQSVKREAAQKEINEELVLKLKESDELKTKFVSLATHQMASPLTSMKVYSAYIKEGGDAGAVKGIENIADNFISIVKDFLDISKIETDDTDLRIESVSISDIVGGVVEVCSTRLKQKDIRVSFDSSSHLRANGDKEKLTQALMNVIENSIKHSMQGSAISIDVLEEREFVCIKVRDKGERKLPKVSMALIKKFSNTQDQSEADVIGSSLGLYSAKQIIEKQGGEFKVNCNNGCQFLIYLKRSNL